MRSNGLGLSEKWTEEEEEEARRDVKIGVEELLSNIFLDLLLPPEVSRDLSSLSDEKGRG